MSSYTLLQNKRLNISETLTTCRSDNPFRVGCSSSVTHKFDVEITWSTPADFDDYRITRSTLNELDMKDAVN